ncbi:MAG: hypothetical protein VKO00_06695 [Cyanobacteriota bacterium]|nr:hypothetical protein [Cyanobacteriota bacterium]
MAPLRCRFRALRLPERHQEGFVLPLVVAVGLLITIGSMALVLRGSGALIGSARQQRSREALAIAEAGLESTMNALNTTNYYLLTNNHDPGSSSNPKPCWAPGDGCITGNATIPGRVCRSMIDGDGNIDIPPIALSGSVQNASGTIGDWRVVKYVFQGSTYFGGTGSLTIEGVRRTSLTGPVLARSRVEQQVSVKLKDCTPAGLNTIALLALEAPMGVNQTEVYALTSEQVNEMAAQQIFPDASQAAAVHCIGCSNLAELNIKDGAVGLWSFGPLGFPPVPTVPNDLSLVPWDIVLKSNQQYKDRQIWARMDRQASAGSPPGSYYCRVKDDITHCRIGNISIKGSEANVLKIIYPLDQAPLASADNQDVAKNRSVRLYIEGDVVMSGQSMICQAVYTGKPLLVRIPIKQDSAVEPDETFRLKVSVRTLPGTQSYDVYGTATIVGSNSASEGQYFPNKSGLYLPVNNYSAQDGYVTVSNPVVSETQAPGQAEQYAVFVITNTGTNDVELESVSVLSVTADQADYDASVVQYFNPATGQWSDVVAMQLAGYQYPPADLNVDPPCVDQVKTGGMSSSFYNLKSRDLLIFGSADCTKQDITLNGGPQALHLFTYAPCASVTINGGADVPDIYGAVWALRYVPSSSGNIQIWVPPDLSSDLEKIYGVNFSINVRRPVALGINRWTSYESTQP